MHVDFASGNWVDIVPIQGLKAKHRDAFEGAPKIYLKFDAEGKPDLSDMPLSLTMSKLQRNGLLSTLIMDWSFSDDNGSKLPVPYWDGTEIRSNESFGEIPLDDMDEIEDLVGPYMAKVQRRPDPKTMTTAGSTALSRDQVPSQTA
jgi:hypothetical protein